MSATVTGSLGMLLDLSFWFTSKWSCAMCVWANIYSSRTYHMLISNGSSRWSCSQIMRKHTDVSYFQFSNLLQSIKYVYDFDQDARKSEVHCCNMISECCIMTAFQNLNKIGEFSPREELDSLWTLEGQICASWWKSWRSDVSFRWSSLFCSDRLFFSGLYWITNCLVL